ncbi:MAG: hypothetical protein HZB23_11650 [Deltaproteobacteria bacterium]|nr:hypothetical protein [Deltaproteobacteria bacterium]
MSKEEVFRVRQVYGPSGTINMRTNGSKKSDAILSVGRWLGDVGINSWALTREQALIALDKLEAEANGILGGDVLAEKSGVLRHNYDNWHCDPEQDESNSAFVFRSIMNTRTYIANYPDTECFFVIVTAL